MKARFIQQLGTRTSLRCYWGEDCPNCVGRHSRGYHNAMVTVAEDRSGPVEGSLHVNGGEVTAFPEDRWPTQCDHCGKGVSADAQRMVFVERLYDSPSGRPEPGDLYWVRSHAPGEPCLYGWTNCDGRHLCAVLPNGHLWDIHSRASNCTRPDDQIHRCWVLHGEPPTVHVDKVGDTCAAGAGSIVAGSYHGFLHHGAFISC